MLHETIKETDAGLEVYHAYDGVSDLEELVQTMTGSRQRRSLESTDGESWYGVEDHHAVVRALKKGWPEGTDEMRDKLGEIELPRLPSIRRKGIWSDHGDEIDIHKVNMGRVDSAWRRRKREVSLSRTGSHMTIAVDVTCGSGVVASEAMWRGAAAVAIAEAAVKTGRNVRIMLVWCSVNTFDKVARLDMSVEAKGYYQNVSTDVLMTMLSLPGFYRYYGFAGYMNANGHEAEFGDRHFALGAVRDFKRDLLEDGSKMVWIGRNCLSAKKAKRSAEDAAKAMMNRIDLEEYSKTG